MHSRSFSLFASFAIVACADHEQSSFDVDFGDAIAFSDATFDITQPETGSPWDFGTPGQAADIKPRAEVEKITEPQLLFAFEGPPAQEVEMGTYPSLFCFSLEAQGASFEVRLPLMQIKAIDGGLVETNSYWGAVFQGPMIKEGDVMVIDPVKVGIADDYSTEVLDVFRWFTVPVLTGTPRHLCLQAGVVEWSLTPEDFYGHSYQVVMGDWDLEDVAFMDSGNLLPRKQIIAPEEVVGNAVTITGPKEDDLYTGELAVKLSPYTPSAKAVEAGAQGVPMLRLDFEASGNGACVRGFDITRHGMGKNTDIASLSLFDATLIENVYNTTLTDGKATFGWHDFGVLFCVSGGETRSYMVLADVSADAVTGTTHSLWIDNIETDVDRVNGVAQGDSPLSGSAFMIVSP